MSGLPSKKKKKKKNRDSGRFKLLYIKHVVDGANQLKAKVNFKRKKKAKGKCTGQDTHDASHKTPYAQLLPKSPSFPFSISKASELHLPSHPSLSTKIQAIKPCLL